MFSYDMTAYMIEEDINLAKTLFYTPNGRGNENGSRAVRELQENPCVMNMVTYFSVQAIEKSLKYYIERENPYKFENIKYSHNVSDLLKTLEEGKQGFIKRHPDIYYNANTLTYCNNLRYSVSSVSKDDAYWVMGVARSIYHEVKRDFEEEMAGRNIKAEEKEHFNRKKPVRFNRTRSERI